MATRGGAPENLIPVRTEEEAKRLGRNGGIKSGEARRRKRDAKNAMKYLLELAATGQLQSNLNTLGVDEEEQTNLMALQARLFTMAMGGNLQAYDRLIKIAGFDPEENRKERESRAAEKRKDAAAKAIASKSEEDDIVANGDEGGEEEDDVLIVLPHNNRPGGESAKFINPEDIPKG